MNFGSELLEITKDNLSEAQFMAANLVNKEVKNRVFLNVAGAEAVMSHLERLGIDTSGISNIHSIKRVADKIDIADIILENIHIDVRVIFDDNYIFVPKSHYKYEIVPDIYVVLKYDNSIERINLLGFFEPSDINFNNANNDYYFVERDKLQSPFDMIDFISNFSGSNKKLLTQAEILRGRELSVMVADHDVNDDEFKEFLGLLLKSNVLRSSVLEYDNFETLASKAAFALRIKKTKKSDDNIVDLDEFMSLDNFESTAEHNSEPSADNHETEDDNGDSMLDDNISEPIIDRTLSIENAAGAVAGSIIGSTIGAGLNGQISASEKAIELAAMAGEEIADTAKNLLENDNPQAENQNHTGYSEKFKNKEDISDFVAEDNELAEPEIENFDAITSESDLDLNINSDEIDESGVIQETEDNIADENIDIDNSLEELPTEESFADLNNSEFDFDISEPPTEELEASSDEKFNQETGIETNNFTTDPFNFDADDELLEFPQTENNIENTKNDEPSETDNLYDENVTSISDINSTRQTDNNIEQTLDNTEEELISLDEVEKTVSDNNIDNTDEDNYLVDFDNSISDKKSDDSVQEIDDNEFSDDDLLVFPDKNESQEENISENFSNENTFDFSDIDNIENNNITDNAEVSFEVIDDFDSFETIAPTEDNFDINFSENDLVENNILDKNSVKENSVVISNKTFNVGEIFIDINKDSSRPETLTENEHLEELYNNSEIQDNTGLNNDVRIISNKSKQIPIFIGIGGLALLVIILGIIVFSVSKFINPSAHEDKNALIENNSTNNLGTDVPNTANINNDNVVMNDNMQRPGRQGINNPSTTSGIQQSQEQIATKPIPATAFLSVKKLSWEVPDYISYDPAFKQYLQSSGKGLKAALSSDLLLATDYTYSDQIRLSITYDRAGNFKNSKILLSSGSSQVDNIVLQSVNQTLRALKAPNSLGNDESTTLILKIYL